jgi:Sulfotransferase family
MPKMKKALFLHTQKTAGSTIIYMAYDCYGLANVASHGDYIGLGRDGCQKYPFISGHFGFQFAEPLMQDRYSFTFLRDPAERLLSLYWFSRAQPEKDLIYDAARENSFEYFLRLGERSDGGSPGLQQWLWNNQAWQLACGFGADPASGPTSIEDFSTDEILSAAIENLQNFNHVGFAETINDDAITIFRALGDTSHNEVLRRNVSKGKPNLEDLPQSTKVLLKKMTEIDQELYSYARYKFGWRNALKLGWRRLKGGVS